MNSTDGLTGPGDGNSNMNGVAAEPPEAAEGDVNSNNNNIDRLIANIGQLTDESLESMQHELVAEIMRRRTRLRPFVREVVDHGYEEYERLLQEQEERNSNRPPSPPIKLSSEMCPKTVNALLSSNLVKMTPAEEERARREIYPIFKDRNDEIGRNSSLYDGIPFAVADPLGIRNVLSTVWEIYYHDETIDWGPLEGWKVPPAVEKGCGGLVVFQKVQTSTKENDIRGYVSFCKKNDREEEQRQHSSINSGDAALDDAESDGMWARNDDMDISDRSHSLRDSEDEIEDSISDDLHSFEADVEDGDIMGDNEPHSDASELLDAQEDAALHDDFDEDNEDHIVNDEMGENVHEHQLEADQSYVYGLLEQQALLKFSIRDFEPERFYDQNSWWPSHSHCSFGVERNVNLRLNPDENYSARVTIFEVNETMAFELGDKQKFISLEDPRNYGTETESNHTQNLFYGTPFPQENVQKQMQVLERMQAYRGSWIGKLCPPELEVPDAVAEHIGQYLKRSSPPPYLFVQKGDLLLLARYKDFTPCPDLEDRIHVGVTREILILAHPSQEPEQLRLDYLMN
jgi:hypothetical protein